MLQSTQDYLDITGPVSEQYGRPGPPREGVAVFRHGEKYYMLTSGMTGYLPNRSDAAVSDTPLGPFVPVGDPHVADESGASFNSQISQVFPLPGKPGAYIALADRWVPSYPVDARLADLFVRVIGSHHRPDRFSATAEEEAEFQRRPRDVEVTTSLSGCPLRWRKAAPASAGGIPGPLPSCDTQNIEIQKTAARRKPGSGLFMRRREGRMASDQKAVSSSDRAPSRWGSSSMAVRLPRARARSG